MPNSIELLTNILLPALLGAIGWFGTNLVIRNIIEFNGLRQKIYEELIFTSNVRLAPPDSEDFPLAIDSLRRLAAKLSAISATSNCICNCYFRLLGYDIRSASENLIGYSNSLNPAEKNGHRAYFRYYVETSLKLPLSYKNPPKLRE